MPPSAHHDAWLFIQEDSLASRKNLRKEAKAVIEEGVGTVWVPEDTDDFVEVSWEDALLPDADEDSNGEDCGSDGEAPTKKIDAPAARKAEALQSLKIVQPSLHPPKESPWADMKAAKQQHQSSSQRRKQPKHNRSHRLMR